MYEQLDNGTVILNGKFLISDTNELLGTDSELNTIGGWFLTQEVEAKTGTTIEYNNYQFIAKEVDGHQVKSIKVQPADSAVDLPKLLFSTIYSGAHENDFRLHHYQRTKSLFLHHGRFDLTL
ncbi:transporter associated domain-containing protein [Alteribacillus sp. JSM 102045]|uniref:transporter associated domain-containing protein n=1 Tax=Alteribacillus sp. JSM 102045 TaxID=1562101 RepID=UPI0035C0BBDB